MERLYLDNAATSFPKPETVYEAMDGYNRELGAAVGRGAYEESVTVQRIVNQCRKRAADLIGAESPDRMIFTFNGTDSLNLAIHGLLQPGDHVVTSQAEHNSVLRPLHFLAAQKQISITQVPCDSIGRVEPAEIAAAIQSNTKLVALIHASNVTGTIQPIEDVGEIARKHGVVYLVDAAQSVGHLPIDVSQFPVDFLAFPGHKGCLGPLGTGLLYIRPGMEKELVSIRQGGTGSQSERVEQPATLPDKYESGNHNAVGLVGLEAGLKCVAEKTVASIREHEIQLTNSCREKLRKIPGITLYGPDEERERVGVISFNLENWEPQILAGILDQTFRIQTRAGFHCAPRIHEAIGSAASGGTVRISFGMNHQRSDLDRVCAALQELATSF